MPPPRRREAALAPLRGATLAPACWNSALGTQGCLSRSRAKQPNAGAPPQERLPHSRTVPSPPWHGASHRQPHTAADTLGWPPRRSSSRVLAAERAGGGLPREPGCCLSPRTQMLKLWGKRRKQQHNSCPPCSSQGALGLKWCQGTVSSAAGMAWGHTGRCKGTVLAVHSLQLCSGPSEVSALPYGQ